MAKLITKFKYLKPSARQSVGGYAKYIATREGVEKVDDTFKTDPSTEKQKKLIEKILRDFPDSNSMLEYEDYLKEPTLGNASEFITRALEDNAHEALNAKTYADYIATRPRAERFGSHGLFTDDGVRVKLEDVSRELNEYEGNVWTVIISLRREDAERLGFNSGERWRDMLRTQTETIAKNFKIPVEDLKWYAAFHNESHHPHVHLMVYSTKQAKPYLTQKGIMNLRSAFAKDVFADDLLSVYEKQTEHRNALRAQSRDVIAEIVSRINSGAYDNPALENKLLDLADRICADPAAYQEVANHKKLATLFYEPSTRTRLSFESAMLALGGKTLGFSAANSSSAAKGETVGDTIHTVSCYADIIAMRHPKEGAPLVASMHSLVPVINAGDGGHNHPTQTLTDLLTIHREMGRFENLTVGLCGDLKFGRTVHSLVSAMSRYPGVRFVLISPEELKLPRYVKEQYIKSKNIPYTQSTDLEAVMPELDILYMTRVQRERFFNEEDYLRLKDSYILTPDKLKGAKEALRILHPLPRVNEISVAVDDDPRACYFKQVQYGKYIRMALILKLLEIK